MRRCARRQSVPIKLSIREEQVINLLLQGLPNRQIALGMGVSEKTVKNYMTILMQKLQAHNRLEVLIAVQNLDTYNCKAKVYPH